jgi:lipopolysaccharide export system permease protein
VGIIDRFILREVMKTLVVILMILFVVLLANYMVKLLGKVAAGSLNSDLLFPMMGYEMIRIMPRLLPAAFFFSLLWVLGSMYRDNEMVALQSGGVGLKRIYRAAMIAATPVVILTGLLSVWLTPWANTGVEGLKQIQKNTSGISGIKPARFNEFQNGNLVVYAESVSPLNGHLLQVFVQHRQQEKLGVINAERAYITEDDHYGARFVVLVNGTRYEGRPGYLDYRVTDFAEYAIRLPGEAMVDVSHKIAAKKLTDLWQADDLSSFAEIQYRFSWPLAVLGFAVLAVPLARSQPRKDVYGRIASAIVAYFIFINLQRVAESWLEIGQTPAWLGLWWVMLLIVGVAGLIILLDSFWLASRIRRFKEARST